MIPMTEHPWITYLPKFAQISGGLWLSIGEVTIYSSSAMGLMEVNPLVIRQSRL